MRLVSNRTKPHHARIKVDGVLLHTTHAEETADANGRTFLCNPSSLEVRDENLFQLAYRGIVVFDKLRETTDFTTDVHGRRGVWNLNAFKDGTESLVSLVFLRDVGDDEGSCIKGLEILWGAEPLLA